jgi:pantetheine-phosphate adenylyltransferase
MALALYPGSFDPFHNGHLDVVEQSVRLFGEVVVGVMHNPDKSGAWFEPERRAEMVRASIAHLGEAVCVETFTGLAADAARRIKADCIVKSARTGGDFEVEQQQAQMHHRSLGVETVLLFSRPCHAFISSRYLRQYVEMGGPLAEGLVPAPVAAALEAAR